MKEAKQRSEYLEEVIDLINDHLLEGDVKAAMELSCD